MKRLVIACACLLVVSASFAATAKTELTLSGALNKPSDGGSTWALTGEVLFPVGPFVLGPSFGLFDSPGSDGQSYGGACELNFGKKSGLFGGAAIHKLGGDVAADYDGEARLGIKWGDGNGFVKVFLSRVWTRDAGGTVAAPDSTSAAIGLGRRW